jgi:hypothetical protein
MTTTLERDTTVGPDTKTSGPKYANGSAGSYSGSSRFHWTVESFYRASDSGVFDKPKQWELISGELWRRDEVNPPHAFTTRKIGRLMRRLFEPTYLVQEEKPIHLDQNSEPMRTFAWSQIVKMSTLHDTQRRKMFASHRSRGRYRSQGYQ